MKKKVQKQLINIKNITGIMLSAIVICIFMMSSIVVVAQNNYDPPPIKWGDISKADFQISAPKFDPDASSLTICRYGQLYVSEVAASLETRVDVHVRFIVLQTDGIDRADIEINFWTGSNNDKIISSAVRKTKGRTYKGGSDGHQVENIDGCVYNLNDEGKIVVSKLEEDQIFISDYSDVANSGTVSFALPNVKVGSIAEIKFTIVKRNIFTVEKWHFQREDPCLHSEYRVSFPDNKAYAVIKKGLMKDSIKFNPSTLTSKNLGRIYDEVYSYELDLIPGLPDEPYVMSMNNIRTQMMIQISEYYDYSTNSNVKIISTWKELANDYKYADMFGRLLNRGGNMYSDLEYVYSGSATDKEKVDKCFNYVRDHFICNEEEWTMADKNLREVYKNNKGSAVEINLFLASFLKHAGFKPKMALVSTRDHGIVNEKYPFVAQFNHAICLLELDGNTIFLDASEKDGNYNFPPSKIVGCKAFVIDPKNPEFVEITTNANYNKFVMCTGNIIDDSLVGKLQFKYKGYAAALEREQLKSDGEEYMHDAVNPDDILVLTNPMFVNRDKNDKPLLTQVDYSMSLNSMKTNELLYINPFKVYGSFKNIFISKERDFSIDFNFPVIVTYMYSITIPDGYIIEDVPENVNTAMADNLASVLIFYQVSGNMIQIKTELKINQMIIPSNEYDNLKTLFELWELKHDEMIVLKKTS